jgi:CTD small phosphatase-like protein 2
MIPFLAIAPNPYLSPTFSTGRYTLVIDCIEVFCQSNKKTRNHTFRPYAQHFLSEMSKYFEIVSYCAALPNQVDRIIDMIDQKRLI